jgi:hypothetical protein
MRYAWVESGRVRDVAQGDPAALYTPDIATHFTTQVPDNAATGDLWDGTTLTKPAPVVAPVPIVDRVVTPPEFMLLFTSAERVAIRDAVAAGTDKVLADWWAIINDARLQEVHLGRQSTSDALAYLVSAALLTQARMTAILAS